MAFTTSGGRTQTALADINITPLVDVVLVLLIIFMVTAPVLQSGIDVSVPKTRTVKQITEERLVITINKDQRVFLGNDAININEIGSKLKQKIRDPRSQFIFVRADENVRSHSAVRSAILHRAPRQTGCCLHNDWRAGEGSRRHSPYCRNRAVQFLKEWSLLLLHGRFRQIRPPGATAREKASQRKFFRSGRKKDKPQQPILAPYTLGVKKNLGSFAHCTVGWAVVLCNRKAIHWNMLDFFNDRAQPPADACPIPGAEPR